jgi:hypothetical protein
MLDKRQRLTEHQVVHAILSVPVSAVARDYALASSRVQGLAAKHSAGTRHVSAGRPPVGVEGGLIDLVGAFLSLVTRSTLTEAERNTG